MDKTVAIIPIKTTSKRISGKNFRKIQGHPLYEYIIHNTINSESFDKIYVDTDSNEIKAFAEKKDLDVLDRPAFMTKDNVNGNDLLLYELKTIPEYEIIFQLFATAPFLKSETIKKCVETLKKEAEIDSVFTVTEEIGWYWFNEKPINYNPKILPRSQDAKHVIKESTGLYGIRRDVLIREKCRIGKKPKQIIIEDIEAIDIDTTTDLEYADFIANKNNFKEMVE
jgi:CMP-N-acetylneuraminic acid synthetase